MLQKKTKTHLISMSCHAVTKIVMIRSIRLITIYIVDLTQYGIRFIWRYFTYLLIYTFLPSEHLQGTSQMNFVFGVVCKIPNSFAKSKNSPTSMDFAFRLGKPKVWTSPLNFFFTDRARAFFSLRAILTYVVRASHRPTQVFAPVAAQPRPRSSFVAVVVRVSSAPSTSVLLRGKVPAREGPPPFPRAVGRAGARGREGGRA